MRDILNYFKNRKRSISYKDFSGWMVILPGLALMYFLVWRPIANGIYLSFFELKGFEAQDFIGLQNYIRVVKDDQFISTLLNTFEYVVWSLAIGFLFPFIFAMILNEMSHGKTFIKISSYLPNILPGVAVSLIWYFMYLPDESGLLNNILARIGIEPNLWLQNGSQTKPLIIISSVWHGFGSTVLYYLASFQGLSKEVYEASYIDGAGIWARIRRITVPQMLPILMLMLVRQIIGVFQIMQEPMVMTDGGPNNASLSLSLQAYYYMFRYFKTGEALALGVIIFVILMIANVFYFTLDKKLDVN